MKLTTPIEQITQRIMNRSRDTRAAYLDKVNAARNNGPKRAALSCGNLAHGMAACGAEDKALLAEEKAPNIGIVSAYNDMLSAHQPYFVYPELIKQTARRHG
ncbi:MAG: phosphogluconate dehydratase, partial [Kangiellaceae bacterium]